MTRHLWLQEEVLAKRVVLAKVRGEENPAHIATKFLGISVVKEHLEAMNINLVVKEVPV